MNNFTCESDSIPHHLALINDKYVISEDFLTLCEAKVWIVCMSEKNGKGT